MKDDDVFVPGTSQGVAIDLLQRAEEHGLRPGVVRSTAGGFIVPGVLLDEPGKKKTPARRKAASGRKSAQGKEGN